MKKLLFTLALLISFGVSAQETLLNDYAKNEMGEYDKSNKYEQLYLSTYTDQKEGKAYNGILIKENKGYASSRRPFIKIPIELVSEFQIFLNNAREKYHKWENTRKENNINDMKKTIDVFAHKLYMAGDDYGYFGGITDVELKFESEGGYSKMVLSAYVSNSVRSDILRIYLTKNNENWRDLALLRLINDLTTEKVQAEIDKINNSGDLFN